MLLGLSHNHITFWHWQQIFTYIAYVARNKKHIDNDAGSRQLRLTLNVFESEREKNMKMQSHLI